MTAESVDISYIEVTAEAFYEPVSEERLREEFELAQQDSQYQTESRVAHILLEQGNNESDTEFSARVTEVQQALTEGTPFEDAAAMYSDDVGSAGSGGNLGFTSGDTFPEAMEEVIAELQPGEISDPVRTDAGTHLIKVLERRAGESIRFEDMRAELTQRVQASEARRELLLTVEQLRDLVFNADDLRRPADELNLQLESADAVTRGNQEGIFGNPSLQSAIFSQDVVEFRHNSEVVEIDADRFIVVHVDNYNEPKLQPIDEVRERIAARLAAERARERSMQQALDIIARLESGETMQQVANDLDYSWQVELGTDRGAGRLPPAVDERGFQLPAPAAGESQRAVTRSGNGDLYVVEVSRVRPGQLAGLDADQRKRLGDRVAGEYAGLVQQHFEKRLREKADITVY